MINELKNDEVVFVVGGSWQGELSAAFVDSLSAMSAAVTFAVAFHGKNRAEDEHDYVPRSTIMFVASCAGVSVFLIEAVTRTINLAVKDKLLGINKS